MSPIRLEIESELTTISVAAPRLMLSYCLQWSVDLVEWTDLQSDPGNGEELIFEDAFDGGTIFYRMKISELQG